MAYEADAENLGSEVGCGFNHLECSPSANSTISQLENQMHAFEPHLEFFNVLPGIDVLGFPWKNQQQRDHDTGEQSAIFHMKSSRACASHSLSKTFNGESAQFFTGFPERPAAENTILVADSAWQESRLPFDDDPSLRFRSAYPIDGSNDNLRQSHGLSLSLCPNKASSNVGLQSLELRESKNSSLNEGDDVFGKSWEIHQHRQSHEIERRFGHHQLRDFKYLIPAQELLEEFCSLRTGPEDKNSNRESYKKLQMNNKEEEEYSKNHSVHSLNFIELQKRKANLVSLLEQVDRRYRQYCERMRSVVSAFEVAAGVGAASVYSSMAMKAMSRHFRCLRDGIVRQIRLTKKAMEDKDSIPPGTTRGETPRLKVLDLKLQQQTALQQMDSHSWRSRRGLPENSISILRAWLFEHFLNPYPNDADKLILARQTGLSRSQVSNWFINARVRFWKPMVEDMYIEETKEQGNKASDGGSSHQDNGRPSEQYSNQNPNPKSEPQGNDQLPGRRLTQLLANHCPESLSTIINKSRDPRTQHHQQESQFSPVENVEAVCLDYANGGCIASNSSYGNGGYSHPHYDKGRVSLTLGLQQNSGDGISLPFLPVLEGSLFFSRQNMEGCPPIQHSVLDGEKQNLPHRNMMGAQLLQDLAGWL